MDPRAAMPRAITALALLIAAASIAGWVAIEKRRTYYRGPVSDHFDGQRFFIPGHPIGKGLPEVIRWRLSSERAQWPDSVPLAQSARPPQRVDGAGLRVTFVGHATVLIQTAGLNILTDPTWAERASLVTWAGPKRVTPPGIAFEDLPPIDVVVVTHSHYDHMDLPTLSRLRKAHDPLIVMPLGNDAPARAHDPSLRVFGLDWWSLLPVTDEVFVHAVPVYHWSRRTAFDRNKALWSGFVIQTPHGSIYVAGDTGMGNGEYFRQAAQRFQGFRLALLPVGAYEPRWFMKDQHVNPAEAVRMHELLRARTSIGVHLRTFQLTDEGIDQPEIDLRSALARHKIPPASFFTLPIGGSWTAPP